MRKVYVLAGLLAVAAGLAGWAEFGRAQPPVVAPAPGEKFGEPPILPEPGVPMPGKTSPAPRPKPVPPVPKPLPVNEPLVDTLPAVMPPLPEPIKDIAPIAPMGDLILPLAPVKSPVESLPDIKAPLVEAPSLQPLPVKPAAAPTAATVTQEPAVSLEWVGPAAPKVGSPADYTVTVKNTCPISLQKVVVQVRIPAGVRVESTEPKADGTDAVLLWDLGTLAAQQAKPLKMRFTPTGKGEMSCQAWVTFTGMATLKVQVRDPKLAVKARAPEKVAVGDPANIVLTVSNPGDGPADHVKLTVTLGAGLVCSRGNRPTFDVGPLAAGESRAITVPCIAKSAGAQQCSATVEADGGLTAADAIAITTVAKSRIDVAVTGPKLRYVDRKAVYSVKVTNSGDAPATNVFVTQAIPTGFKFVATDNGGQHDAVGGTVKWFVGEIAAGATQEVKAELVAIAAGDFTHKVAVTATGDLACTTSRYVRYRY